MRVKDRVIVVTGGGSGLGEKTVDLLVEKGAKVGIFDMNAELGEKKEAQHGAQVVFCECDVTSEESVAASLSKVVKKFGAIHGVVNCAGVASAIPTLGKNGPSPQAPFDKVLQINVSGSFNVSRQAAWIMSKQPPVEEDKGEYGAIVNVASVAAYEGQKGQAAYSASKGAVVAMALPMARDMARFGIRVNVVAPGVMATPMTDVFPQKVRESLLKDIPCKRFGKPEEFAHACLFLLENSYMNGTTIRVDGGIRMSNL
uniref:Ketoreductase domain-containing protein n=1 Tax=Chromera velia CCMP2878 TaxID=1169474 RepID=A0A0G4FKL3_9ALVE|mmetsp:Transcript_24960/g.48862  ORF Transcript_24960/g.48862 Transcript_24960/m.48862 type:complete len:257 (+) Transcript_24960:92-862(+)|eukprot:Cvel_17356.t1-p1 / transcript=Cvel_17356.t1 / gene=Cvel_17356 / organism=Chromera_velia_CCMP2878 / gene_product=3-hydroxyacyl-CoA dehydrogenase type-2, putative / transcript_product=3-hydroxyacyl-CoA dehydrogenase type-2, putative / location=Cvel_scaffold1379:13775-16562(-) / protein_length=256 / sequence_SO=supercontig / SO=protein_coding / is_pseudo=false